MQSFSLHLQKKSCYMIYYFFFDFEVNKSSNQNARRREIASNRALSDVEINACTVVISGKTVGQNV